MPCANEMGMDVEIDAETISEQGCWERDASGECARFGTNRFEMRGL